MPNPNQAAVGKKAAVGGAALTAILAAVFAVEGGYVNDPRDPGGETNHGITKRVAREQGYKGSMKALTKDKAREIVVGQYVIAPGYMPLVEIDPAVAEEVIDSGVNTGTGRSSKWLQESINAFNNGGKDYADIAVDGRVGPGTMRAYEALRKKRGKALTCLLMLRALDAKQAAHYLSLTKLETYTVGWFRTRIGNVDAKRCTA